MKSTKSLLATLAVILFAGIAFISCEGIEASIVKPEDAEELKNSAIQNSQADNAMGDVLGAISTYGIAEDWTKKTRNGDPTVVIDSVTATITYPNGGVIKVVWNKPPGFIEGLVGTVTITNFVFDDNVTINNGSLNVTFNGAIDQPILTAEGSVNMTIENNSIVFTINRTFIWYAGFSTLTDFSDDAYAIYGTSNLVDGDETHKTTILQDQMLIHYHTCAYPQQGITKMEVIGKNRSVTVDFGVDEHGNANNECDAYARFTYKIGNASLSAIVNLGS